MNFSGAEFKLLAVPLALMLVLLGAGAGLMMLAKFSALVLRSKSVV